MLPIPLKKFLPPLDLSAVPQGPPTESSLYVRESDLLAQDVFREMLLLRAEAVRADRTGRICAPAARRGRHRRRPRAGRGHPAHMPGPRRVSARAHRGLVRTGPRDRDHHDQRRDGWAADAAARRSCARITAPLPDAHVRALGSRSASFRRATEHGGAPRACPLLRGQGRRARTASRSPCS